MLSASDIYSLAARFNLETLRDGGSDHLIVPCPYKAGERAFSLRVADGLEEPAGPYLNGEAAFDLSFADCLSALETWERNMAHSIRAKRATERRLLSALLGA